MSSKYLINNIEYPSVTTITGLLDKSSALMPWAVNNAVNFISENINEYDNVDDLFDDSRKHYRDVSKEAMDIGSEVHDRIEKYIKFGKDAIGAMRPEVESAMIAFFEWEEKNIDKWIESEMPVVNEKYGYAGTLDAIAKFKDGKVNCIDFKSSKGFYDGYDMQVIAYKYARESMSWKYDIKGHTGDIVKEYSPIEIDGCGVLRLDKITGKPEYKDYTKDMNVKYTAFLYLLSFYYIYKKRKLKNNKIRECLFILK